jgi:catechol 2,3-dioxygenase-like lactoylglutathione lyase family enzyme
VAASPQDRGLTHVALPVADTARSVGFYERFADMTVVHRRVDQSTGASVVWLSDLTRPFVIVLIETTVSHRLGGYAHLGVGCASRAEVDARCAVASRDGREVLGPFDDGPPVGYWSIIVDPDGHNLELSHGQEVAFTVARHDGPGKADEHRR